MPFVKLKKIINKWWDGIAVYETHATQYNSRNSPNSLISRQHLADAPRAPIAMQYNAFGLCLDYTFCTPFDFGKQAIA